MKRKTHNNFQWRYKEDDATSIQSVEAPKTLAKKVAQIDVKTGEIYTKYNVYVYPITNNTKIDYKNVKITKK
jgi:hypothetical protein